MTEEKHADAAWGALGKVTISELSGNTYVDATETAELLAIKTQRLRNAVTERVDGVRKQNGREYSPGAIAMALPKPAGILHGAGRGVMVWRRDDVLAAKEEVHRVQAETARSPRASKAD